MDCNRYRRLNARRKKVSGIPKGTAHGPTKRDAKEEAARQAFYSLGWAPPAVHGKCLLSRAIFDELKRCRVLVLTIQIAAFGTDFLYHILCAV